MIVDVERGCVERATLQNDEHKVAAVKLAQRLAAAVVVEAMDIVVEPHLSPAERRLSVRFQRNLVHLIAGEEVAARLAAFDHQRAEIVIEYLLFELRIWLQKHMDHLGFAVGIGGEIKYAAARLSGGEVVFTVVRHGRHVEAFDIAGAVLAVTVDDVVRRATVVLLEHGDMEKLSFFLLAP